MTRDKIAERRISADLTSARVIVTGAGSGIGLATARTFAHCGATVGCNHLPGDELARHNIEMLKEAGLDVVALPGNIADPKAAVLMITEGINQLGGLDVLVNNAGASGVREPIPFGDLDAVTQEIWELTLSTNLLGAFHTCRTAAPALRASRGAIVNVASTAGLGGDGSSIAYAASKAALVNLTRNLAKGLGPEVNVNAVAPGLTRTPWTDDWPEARKKYSLGNTMLKRMVEPSDLADAIVFLSVQGAITGQTLQVDCGRMF